MPGAEGTGFRRIGERERLAGGFFQIVTGTFVDPDGFTFEREIVRHPGAVCVVALEDDASHVLGVRQYRAPVDQLLLELPAGKRDVAGEPAERCAKRELAEEAGVEAARWTELGRFYNSPGFNDEQTIAFLAEVLTPTEREADGTEERHMTIERIDLEDLDQLVTSGVIVDAKTIIACQLARHALDARKRVGPSGNVAFGTARDGSAGAARDGTEPAGPGSGDQGSGDQGSGGAELHVKGPLGVWSRAEGRSAR